MNGIRITSLQDAVSLIDEHSDEMEFVVDIPSLDATLKINGSSLKSLLSKQFHPLGGEAELELLAQSLIANEVRSVAFQQGLQINGYRIMTDPVSGVSTLYIGNIVADQFVTDQTTIQKVASVGGVLVLSQASADVLRVEEVEGGYKCWYKPESGLQSWEVLDQAFCKTPQKSYWQLVTSVSEEANEEGEHWFEVSATNGTGGGIPTADDKIMLLGHQGTDVYRQRATVLSSGTLGFTDPIVHYRGISGFTLLGKEFLNLGGEESLITTKRLVFQSEDGTESIQPNDRGDWSSENIYYNYDRSNHTGSIWQCTKDGTTSEPKAGNTDWVEVTSAASTALTTAQAAQNTANSASTTAQTAQTTANSASTKADSAQTTANKIPENLGYSSYLAMVEAAVAGKTIVNIDGTLNAELIKANAIKANMIDVTDLVVKQLKTSSGKVTILDDGSMTAQDATFENATITGSMQGVLKLEAQYSGAFSEANLFYLRGDVTIGTMSLGRGATHIGKVIKLYNASTTTYRKIWAGQFSYSGITTHTASPHLSYYYAIPPLSTIEMTCFSIPTVVSGYTGSGEWVVTNRYNSDASGMPLMVFFRGKFTGSTSGLTYDEGEISTEITISSLFSYSRYSAGHYIFTYKNTTYASKFGVIIQGIWSDHGPRYGTVQYLSNGFKILTSDDPTLNDATFEIILYNKWFSSN